jgi:hypothetical protein
VSVLANVADRIRKSVNPICTIWFVTYMDVVVEESRLAISISEKLLNGHI